MIKGRYFYVWFVPVAWSACSLLGFRYPGDEYGLWALGSIAGGWLLFFVGNVGSMSRLLPPLIFCGAAVMALAGLVMDLLRAKRWLFFCAWAIAAPAIGLLTVSRYPSYQEAINKNGSLWAYVFWGCNAGLYVAVFVSVGTSSAFRLFRTAPRRKKDDSARATLDTSSDVKVE